MPPEPWNGFGEIGVKIEAPGINEKPWKIKGWNLQPSSMKRKENDLNQTFIIMFHVNLQGS